jgi:hypothetical protein
MRDLAVIARIQKIEAIPNYDRVELATVENYPVIVKKDEFDVGDLCVYVYYDTLLPIKPEFEFLRKNSYSKMYNMFRIRNMKMCGVYSSGIVFPLSILPSTVKIKEGVDVSDVLGIKKYDPEEAQEMKYQNKQVKHCALYYVFAKYKWFRKLFLKRKYVVSYPETIVKSDETNIEKIFNHLKTHCDNHKYYVTEKMEGQAGTWLLLGKKRKYCVYSHNTARNPKGDGNWEKVGKMYFLEHELRSEKKNYAIQGEICGPNIQGNIYKLPMLQLFVYKVTEVDTGRALNFQELVDFCKRHALPMVPVLRKDVKLLDTVEDMLADCEGHSIYGKDIPREGVVWRSMTDQSVGCKAKSRSYQLWFAGNKKTE